MKLNLPKTIDGGSRMRPYGGIKKCTNHEKTSKISKSGKTVRRGYSQSTARKIDEFHAKRMADDKALRIKLGNF